jgi:hypothetical protein
MSPVSPTPGRRQVIAMLAAYGDRPPEDVAEQITSLELVWLLHCVEQQYGIQLDSSSDEIARISTVSDAVGLLRKVTADADHG